MFRDRSELVGGRRSINNSPASFLLISMAAINRAQTRLWVPVEQGHPEALSILVLSMFGGSSEPLPSTHTLCRRGNSFMMWTGV